MNNTNSPLADGILTDINIRYRAVCTFSFGGKLEICTMENSGLSSKLLGQDLSAQ